MEITKSIFVRDVRKLGIELGKSHGCWFIKVSLGKFSVTLSQVMK